MAETGTVHLTITADTSQFRDEVDEIQLKVELLNARTEAAKIRALEALTRHYARRKLKVTERLIDLYHPANPRRWVEQLSAWRQRRALGV